MRSAGPSSFLVPPPCGSAGRAGEGGDAVTSDPSPLRSLFPLCFPFPFLLPSFPEEPWPNSSADMFYFLHGLLKHVDSLLTFKVRRSQREIQISGLSRETTSSASRPSSLRSASSVSEACVVPVGWARAPRRSPAQPSSLSCGLVWPPSWNVRAVPLT